MLDRMQLKKFIWAWLASFWSASAWAATATFASDLSKIPPAAVAVAIALSFIGGAAATLQKIANPDFVVKNVALEIAKDICGSLVAGLVTYSLCAWQELPLLLQPGCITIAGYGGSRVLERYLAAGIARIDRFSGKPEGTP
ncbi:phage holin family protein [Massilia sp. GCM10020059]|uniref:Phage holin family protein n=1 Tax=Massilia agrisoli TaxID=2892444 RepID=A0ABS8IW42_9BURK|nr:phage holin family protein [Massilia agrisoli]MCC6071470.1 phage holin family protein [Massilia agrisoli]